MNVLVTIISVFAKTKEEKKYDICLENSTVNSINAFHTNVSIVKSLSKLKDLTDNGGIEKILALVSWKVMNEEDDKYDKKTAYEYYESEAKSSIPNSNVIPIYLENENGNDKNIAEILQNICAEIKQDDIVYIDSSGGRRTTSNIIQLLAKLLKYKGIRNPCTLYADINGKNNRITDTKNFLKMTDLADAFNEFMVSGRTKQLLSCFSNTSSEEIKDLLFAMTEFSDKIQLGNIENLDVTITKLRKSISDFNNIESKQDIETVILKEFIPVIEEKLIGSESEKVDYVKIIKWCLENMLIQQALTIFVEKIPVYIFDHGIIKFAGDERKARSDYEKERNKINPANWETNVFYSDILDIQNPLLKSLITYLNDNINPKNEKCKEIIQLLNKIEKSWPNVKIPAKYSYLSSVISEGKYRDFERFKNALKTQKKLLCRMLDIDSQTSNDVEGDKTLSTKFKSIQAIRNGFIPESYVFKVDNERIAQIYYGYMYVKTLRNQTNHASSEEILTKDQKDALCSAGYSMSKNDLETSCDNVLHALMAVTSAENKLSETLVKERTVEIIPTNLKIGDVVRAKCIDIKKVRIDDYPYDIQLVIPKGVSVESFLHSTFNVSIKQISKNGKIIQVNPV